MDPLGTHNVHRFENRLPFGVSYCESLFYCKSQRLDGLVNLVLIMDQRRLVPMELLQACFRRNTTWTN